MMELIPEIRVFFSNLITFIVYFLLQRALAAEKRLAKQVAATGVDIINVT